MMLAALAFVLGADVALATLYYFVPGPLVEGYVCSKDGKVLVYNLNGNFTPSIPVLFLFNSHAVQGCGYTLLRCLCGYC
jgi:hypothetical protein